MLRRRRQPNVTSLPHTHSLHSAYHPSHHISVATFPPLLFKQLVNNNNNYSQSGSQEPAPAHPQSPTMSEAPYDPYIPAGQGGSSAGRDGNQRTAALQAVGSSVPPFCAAGKGEPSPGDHHGSPRRTYSMGLTPRAAHGTHTFQSPKHLESPGNIYETVDRSGEGGVRARGGDG